MTAAPLPRCPVCGRAPEADEPLWTRPEVRFERGCSRWGLTTGHNIEASGRTQAEADARWRRVAGGKT